jgi:hypothetical protein
LKTKYGLYPAISIVVANMIGTGISTSLGFQVMGEDYPLIRWLGHTSKNDTPSRAIYIQAALAIVYILSSNLNR